MTKYVLVFLLLIFSFSKINYAQTCNALGQNPGTAFPVCGTSTFSQSNVPVCGNKRVVSKCSDAVLTDKNPFWYKFTCFTSGTLGFRITPNNLGDDYDWQLFDVTNKNPDDLYNDLSMFVACNWSGEKGITGASAAGNNVVICDNLGKPLFSAMPALQQGHQYLLLVSHFTDTQSGYSLSFEGGTASITDPTEPHLQSARAICDGTTIAVKLNKKMKCNSLDASGSEFSITPAFAQIINARGIGCSNSFDMDSLVLTLNAPVPPGSYKISVKKNTSGLTLLDNCDRSIPVTDTQSIIVYPQIPTPMDSVSKLGCKPDVIQLVFSKPMMCSTIEPTGSDFTVTGPSPVSIQSCSGLCNADGLSNIINIKLNASLKKGGVYQILLKKGTDGNTVKNECAMETPAGSAINVIAYDTVSAMFTNTIQYGCKEDIVSYRHDGNNAVNKWNWQFDDNIKSSAKDTSITYTLFNEKNAKLIVSNGVCTDSFETKIILDNYIKANFENSELLCPNDEAVFKNTSVGNISNWKWDFGNTIESSLQDPPNQKYQPASRNTDYRVRLIISNNYNCFDTLTKKITVFNSCNIAVPTAFTPNNDGLNDYLYPVNAYKAINLKFKIYNRTGQLVFETADWTKKWDGTLKGKLQDAGAYVWYLEYVHKDTGVKNSQKGSSILIR